MAFKLEIDTDNDAFQDGNESAEIARILRNLASVMLSGQITTYKLRDVNGNTVGEAEPEPAPVRWLATWRMHGSTRRQRRIIEASSERDAERQVEQLRRELGDAASDLRLGPA